LKEIERTVITNKEQTDIFFKILDTLNEAQTRWYVAREAMLLGHGGIKKMCDLTGISKPTVIRGIKEIKLRQVLAHEEGRIRQPGAGRKKIEEKNPEISNILRDIMNETTMDDPASLLKWTTKSTYQISTQVKEAGYSISEDTIQRRLKEMNYSLQSGVKKGEGIFSNEYDNQFQYINILAKEHIQEGNPVLSVDIQKKVKKGIVKDCNKKLHKKEPSEQMSVQKAQGLSHTMFLPYEGYAIHKNNGMVSVGVSYNTIEFAVESMRRWWFLFGSKQYPNVKNVMICINGNRNGNENNNFHEEEWIYCLQKLCNEIHLSITVCHYPPGISKWNKIEYSIFSLMDMNWKEEPLLDFETAIHVIGSPAVRTGLKMKTLLNMKNSRMEVGLLDYQITELHKDFSVGNNKWNSTILPKRE
jgi:hypothetical protein